MVTAFLGTLIVFLISCTALMVGQWFGRPPIEGRCRPRTGDGCGSANCCQLDRERRER